MHRKIEVFGEIKRCAYSRAAILGFAVFIMMADLAFGQSVTVNLAYGNKYKLEVTKNQGKACVSGNKICVVANVEYDFKYTAIPAADWLVVEPNPNPTTVTKTFAQADAGK
ncbi:MAG: hypothetical protein NTV49_02595, partial [Kiritimatiellaeota bacterium]|nr:hypothetical protein [Kiritimatiellota bacterium]